MTGHTDWGCGATKQGWDRNFKNCPIKTLRKWVGLYIYTVFKFNFDFLSGAVTSNTIQQRNLQGSFDNFKLMLPALHNKEQQKAALHSSQGIAFYSILYISTLHSSSLYRRTIGRYGSHSFMPSLQLFRFSSLSFLFFSFLFFHFMWWIWAVQVLIAAHCYFTSSFCVCVCVCVCPF